MPLAVAKMEREEACRRVTWRVAVSRDVSQGHVACRSITGRIAVSRGVSQSYGSSS